MVKFPCGESNEPEEPDRRVEIMPTCILCGGETFNEFDGHFFCDSCGTQSQEIRNEADVEEDIENLTHGHSQHREMKTKRKVRGPKQKYPKTDFGKPWLTYEAFQCLLKAQVKALIDLGVDPSIRDIVRQIWFRLLNKKNIAFAGARDGNFLASGKTKLRDRLLGETPYTKISEILKDSSQLPKDSCHSANEKIEDEDDINKDDVEDECCETSSGDDTSGSDSDVTSPDSSDSESEEEHIGSLRYKNESSNGSWNAMQHRQTIVILYLALLYAKESITIADILRLVSRGRIPYYKLSKILPSHMKFSKEDSVTFASRPLRISKIHEGANFLLNYLDLPKIPEPDIFLLIAKLILDLQLPAAIHRLTVSLVKACEYKPRTDFRYQRTTDCNEYYEEMVTAFIIVALKLVYGLDGKTEKSGRILEKYLDVPMETLECWSCIVLRLEKKRRSFIQKNYPTCEEDLHYIKDCTNYSLYCSEVIFKHETGELASRQKQSDIHSQYKACRSNAKAEYYQILSQAVNSLEDGKPKEVEPLSSSSFVFDHILPPKEEKLANVSCMCNKPISREVMEHISDTSKRIKLPGIEEQPYLIYLNDLSGLRFHDSYTFLLDIFARRILIQPNEVHNFVTYVESLLFVDPT